MQKLWLQAWRIGRCVPTALLAIAETLGKIYEHRKNPKKMNNPYRLSYCNVCQNKKYDDNKLLLCGLTNSIPDFKKNCPNYIYDSIERDNLIRKKKLSNEMQNKDYHLKKGVFKNPLDIVILNTEQIQEESNFDSPQLLEFYEFRNTKTLGQFTIITFLIIASFFLAIYSIKIINAENFTDILLILSIYILLLYFIKPLRLIRKATNKSRIVINQHGLIIEKTIINWQEVLLTYIKIEKFKLSNSYYLVVSKVNSPESIDYKIDYLEISYKDLSNIIESFKKTYWNKTLPNNVYKK